MSVPADGLPELWVADGPPCRTPFVDVSALWSAEITHSPDREPPGSS